MIRIAFFCSGCLPCQGNPGYVKEIREMSRKSWKCQGNPGNVKEIREMSRKSGKCQGNPGNVKEIHSLICQGIVRETLRKSDSFHWHPRAGATYLTNHFSSSWCHYLFCKIHIVESQRSASV